MCDELGKPTPLRVLNLEAAAELLRSRHNEAG